MLIYSLVGLHFSVAASLFSLQYPAFLGTDWYLTNVDLWRQVTASYLESIEFILVLQEKQVSQKKENKLEIKNETEIDFAMLTFRYECWVTSGWYWRKV